MDDSQRPALTQAIGPAQLAFYAAGSMLGAGIYGLIGLAAGIAGNAIWLSFIVALIAALLTALSYASLGSRHPKAGGTAYIVERAFRRPYMGFAVGVCMIASAFIGIPTLAKIFSQNFATLFSWGDASLPYITVGFLFVLGVVCYRGIRESIWLNVLCCCIEAGGLIFVVISGIAHWGSVDYLAVPPATESVMGLGPLFTAVMASTIFTFFAFIGFEDVMNVAEECKDPQRTLPFGLLTAMAAVAFLYIAVGITAVSAVPWEQLAESKTPLTDVIRVTASFVPPNVFTVIALFAITNTILVNYVTASRLLYGMAQQKLAPRHLGRVHETRRTPHVAIGFLFLCFVPSAIFGTVSQLAAASTLLLLTVFLLMNVSLVILQRRKDEAPGKFEIHPIFPVMGAAVCVILIASRVITGEWTAPVLAVTMVSVMMGVYMLVTRLKRAG